MDHKALRARVDRFVPLSDEDFSLLLQCVRYISLKKGEVLLKEGELCRSFYLVDKGYLRTSYNKDGMVINLNFTFEGDFTTNLKSYQQKTASDSSIEAGEDVAVWVFDFSVLAPHINDFPQLNRFLRRIFMRLLVVSEEYNNLFKIYTPTERYHYIEKNHPELLQRVSLSQIASYLGIARETLSRIRAKATDGM